jgi:flagellar hook assembly protein FlgD
VTLTVFVDRESPFLESRYDNDSAAVVVDPSTVVGVQSVPLKSVTLGGAVPNPTRSFTHISFAIPIVSHVRLDVFDIAGRRVAPLLDSNVQPGVHSVEWDGTINGGRAPSGMYFYELRANGLRLSRRVVFVR